MIFESNFAMIAAHLVNTGTISIREAMNDYNMSGGHLTKVISVLRHDGFDIDDEWRNHPITNRRYKRYFVGENERKFIAESFGLNKAA